MQTMRYFFVLEKDAPSGIGFKLWNWEHIAWVCFLVVLIVILCLIYRKISVKNRKKLRIAIGCIILVLRLADILNYVIQGGNLIYNLPLHLCGLAVFFTFFHSLKPTRTIGNFLYSSCMPGALFALLFPAWNVCPAFGFYSIICFVEHALIVAYPIMLLSGRDIKREAKKLPLCLAILVGLSVPIYFLDKHFQTNYMFLMEPAPGSPLEWFASFLGNPGYLLGYLALAAVTWTILYLPYSKIFKK